MDLRRFFKMVNSSKNIAVGFGVAALTITLSCQAQMGASQFGKTMS